MKPISNLFVAISCDANASSPLGRTGANAPALSAISFLNTPDQLEILQFIPQSSNALIFNSDLKTFERD